MSDETASNSNQNDSNGIAKGKELLVVAAEKYRPAHHRRFKLTSLRAVRREIAAVYAEARNGQMALADACRYAYILSSLAKVMESADLETRLKRIEQMGNINVRQH